MNDLQAQPSGRVAPPAPSMHSLKPGLCLALADRAFVVGGGPAWSVENALDLAARERVEQFVQAERRALEAAMRPASPQWLADRLTVLWATYMASRAAADPRALAVWMAETGGLLSDLPHDILAAAIDTAIQRSRHGFIPSVGEIRQFADPLVEQRELHLSRLAAMEAALADADATEVRRCRRAERAAHDEHMANLAQQRAVAGCSDDAFLRRLERAQASGAVSGAVGSDKGA